MRAKKAVRRMIELTTSADQKNIPAVIEFVNRELDALDCSMKTEARIDIAIDEIYSNIVKYGYEEEGGEVTVSFDVLEDPLVMTLSFLDQGKPFNPLESKDPDTTLSAKERKIGGLGIFMVKKTMDDIRYEYRDGKNILTIRKTL